MYALRFESHVMIMFLCSCHVMR